MTCVVDRLPAWLMTFVKILTTNAPHVSQTRRGVDNDGKQPENLSPNFSGCIKLDATCVLYRYVHVFAVASVNRKSNHWLSVL